MAGSLLRPEPPFRERCHSCSRKRGPKATSHLIGIPACAGLSGKWDTAHQGGPLRFSVDGNTVPGFFLPAKARAADRRATRCGGSPNAKREAAVSRRYCRQPVADSATEGGTREAGK